MLHSRIEDSAIATSVTLRVGAITLLGATALVSCTGDIDVLEPGGAAEEYAVEEAASEMSDNWADGRYYYIRAKHSDRCMHQHGAVLHNGGAITQWECVDQYNVQWKFEDAPDGHYYIRARHSGKCAHQHGATQGNGDPITQWDCVNLPNVKWRLLPSANNYYYMQVQHSGKCMHVHGARWDNGTPITQWDCIDQPNVLWWFDPVGH
ncbi:RICIN domain-containing protein [Sorangium sp. So ce260]|uniref:RICIN domain-containing protein n=1 Tax=Sorangium sp. So ce260 TaxID=3133291 RepID=UPI003F62EAC0